MNKKSLFHRLRLLFGDGFFRHSTSLFSLNLFANIANYIYQIYANRNLSKDDYGLLNALFSLSTVIGVLGDILRQWMTKSFTEIRSKKLFSSLPSTVRYFLGMIVILILLTLVAGALSRNAFPEFFKTTSSFALVLFISIVSVGYLALLPGSLLDSFEKFFEHALSGFLGTVIKLGVLFLLIWKSPGGFNFHGALLAQLASVVTMSFIIGYLASKKTPLFSKTETLGSHPQSKDFLFFLKIGMATVFLTVLFNGDMLIARLAMNAETSGEYSTASTFGKAVFYLSVVLTPLVFVSWTDRFHRGEPYLSIFFKGLFGISLIAGGGVIGLALFIHPFLKFLSPVYQKLVPEILLFAITTLPYIFIQFLSVFFVSMNRYRIFLFLSILMALLTIPLVYWGTDLRRFIYLRGCIGLCLLILMSIYFFWKRKSFGNKGSV